MIINLSGEVAKGQALQTFSRTPQAAEQSDGGQGESDFEKFMRQVLQPESGNKVSEEQLFAGLIQRQVQELKGDEALAKFNEIFDAKKNEYRKPDGFIPYEDAARSALREFLSAGDLTEEEANQIYSFAFAGAQLDDNKDTLWDSRGGVGDPTMAIAELEAALLGARTKLEAYAAGTELPEERSLSESSAASGSTGGAASGSPVDGANGFLYKPVSDSDGKLVVLLPSSYTGQISGVALHGPNGEKIEAGTYRGVGNGEREHFRFQQPGGSYPDGLTVKVMLKDGSELSYLIEDSAMRYD